MKLLPLLMSISLFSHTSIAQSLPSGDSMQIHARIEDWNKAWVNKDYILATKWYSDDARFTNAFGDKCNGRSEIEKLLKDVFSLSFVMSGKSESTEHRYQPLGNDNVIVHTAVIRKGQQAPDGAALPDRKTTHLRVFQKDREGWKIKAHLISDARDKQAPAH